MAIDLKLKNIKDKNKKYLKILLISNQLIK